jgi:WD40 repeat protein
MRACLIIAIFLSISASARVDNACNLQQTPIIIGGYEPKENLSVHLSAENYYLGQVTFDGTVNLWSLPSPDEPVFTLAPEAQLGENFDLNFSSGAHYVAIDAMLPDPTFLEHGIIHIYNILGLSHSKSFDSFIANGSETSVYTFSASEKLFAWTSFESSGRQINIYNFAQDKIIELPTSTCALSALAFNSDETIIAAKDMCFGNIILFDIKNLNIRDILYQESTFIDTISSPGPGLIFWNKDKFLVAHATSLDFIQVWDIEKKTTPYINFWFNIDPIITNPQKTNVAFPGLSGGLHIVKNNSPSIDYIFEPFGLFDIVISIKYNRTGTLLAAGSVNGQVALLDAYSYTKLCQKSTIKNQQIDEFSFINNKDFYTLADDGTISIWLNY